MSFASPAALAALALVPVLLVAYVVAERRRARRTVVDAPLRAAVLPRAAGWRRHVPIGAGLAAAALLLASLAKPQATRAVPVEQATVVIATDRSGSMLAKDVRPDRLTAAREAAEDFLDAVPDDLKVGAVAFNHEPTVLTSPTRDHQAVEEALQGVRAAGSTATGDALAAALRLARDTPAKTGATASPAAIVLLSDGKSVRGRDVLEVAREAKAAKVPVYTVSLGTADGTITTRTGTSQVPPDTATMRQVAQLTGGRAFAIEDADELRQVYEALGSQLATEDRKEDVVSWFAGGALLLLTGGTITSLRLVGRPL